MSYLHDRVYDNGLSDLVSNATRLDICSTEPATYTEATSTYTLGNKTSVTVGSPGARSPSGRKVTVPSVSSGTVTGTGTAGYWGLSDTSNSRLYAASSLSATQSVTSGNTFATASFDIGIPGPA